MKATVEIADEIFTRAERLAHAKHMTFDALAEEGLRLVLSAKAPSQPAWTWNPVTCQGQGIAEEFRQAGWEAIRDEAYGAASS